MALNPLNENNRLPSPDKPSSLRIASHHPHIIGYKNHLPPFGAVMLNMYAFEKDKNYPPSFLDAIDSAKLTYPFEALTKDYTDIYFGPPPSELLLEVLRADGLTSVQTPIARNALVFFVHRDNPVQGITAEQIRHLCRGYGKMDRIGGDDGRILAFHNSTP